MQKWPLAPELLALLGTAKGGCVFPVVSRATRLCLLVCGVCTAGHTVANISVGVALECPPIESHTAKSKSFSKLLRMR